MVKQGELILDRSKGSGKVAGKPGEDAVERKNGFEVEVVATDGEGAYTVFEFLYGLLADRDAAAGEMETQKVETFDKVCNLCLGRGQTETQLVPKQVVHESQGLFSVSVATAQDHEIVGIAHEAVASECHSLVKQVQDDVCQERRNHPALGRARQRRKKRTVFHNASREKFAKDMQDITIGHPFRHAVEDEVMGDVIERSHNLIPPSTTQIKSRGR